MRVSPMWPAGSTGARTSPWRLFLAALIAGTIAALVCVYMAGAVGADDDDDDGGEAVSRQIVVKLRPATEIGYINNKYRTRTIERLPGADKIYLLLTPEGANPAAVANRIQTMEASRVFYAEPNFRAGSPEGSRRHNARPGGTPTPDSEPGSYRDQYAVQNLNLSAAHRVNRGTGSVVAVIDTGVQVGHRELGNRLTTARSDFIDGDSTPYDVGNGRDDDGDGVRDELVGHGTHVAGIVALTAPGARIMPVRALDSEGRGTTFGIAEAIRYSVNNGADVVNLSLGSSQESDLLEDLIGDDDDDDSADRTVFVAAAGNDANAVPQYPAAEDNAVAVSSVDETKKKSDFANFGDWVTVAAPGSDIYSPFPPSRYAMWSGTSMATPFVAGQAALIRSLRPNAPAECVTETIGRTAQSLAASDPTFGSRLGGHADIGASTAYARSNPCPAGEDD